MQNTISMIKDGNPDVFDLYQNAERLLKVATKNIDSLNDKQLRNNIGDVIEEIYKICDSEELVEEVFMISCISLYYSKENSFGSNKESAFRVFEALKFCSKAHLKNDIEDIAKIYNLTW